jgi:hypothetical protein
MDQYLETGWKLVYADYFLGASAFLSSAFAGALLLASAEGVAFFSSFLAGAAAGAAAAAAGLASSFLAAGAWAKAVAANIVAIRVAINFILKFPFWLM